MSKQRKSTKRTESVKKTDKTEEKQPTQEQMDKFLRKYDSGLLVEDENDSDCGEEPLFTNEDYCLTGTTNVFMTYDSDNDDHILKDENATDSPSNVFSVEEYDYDSDNDAKTQDYLNRIMDKKE